MNIVYLQCDMRFNSYLMEKIGSKKVIEHTISRINLLNADKVIAAVYDCGKNVSLIDTLKENNVEIVLSKENDVNVRFLNTVKMYDVDYVVRVGGDQVLLDYEITNHILQRMNETKEEFFYNPYSACIIPDIVSMGCIKKYWNELIHANRYFQTLLSKKEIKKYCGTELPYVLYDFRVNSNEGLRICKNVIQNRLNVYVLSKKLALKLIQKDNYLNRTGLLSSWIIGSTSCDFFYDEEKKINPWMGKSIIDLIKSKVNSSMRVFEWGSGNSTMFWSQYVKEVVSIENNFEWYSKMKEKIASNVKLQYVELVYGGEYCKKILQEGDRFDIISIDGRDRVNCAINSIQSLKEDGVIIWDNTERESYQPGYDFLMKNGFKMLELNSVIYGLPGSDDHTAIFYRENNVFDL